VAGTWREGSPSPAQGVVAERGIYELDFDGSNHFRRVLAGRPNQPPAVLNRQGTRAAFEMFVKGKYVVSIYAVPEWNLLHTWGITRLTKAHCPGCEALSYGWLADGKRFYFELGLVGEKESNRPNIRDTSYIVSENGTDFGAIPPEFSILRLRGYIQPPFAGRHFLGQLSDGSNLFSDDAVRKGEPFRNLKFFLVIFHPHSRSRKQFPLKSAIRGGFVSPSGRYLAYLQRRQLPNYRVEFHLQVKNLESGEEKDVFVSPPRPNPSNSPKPNVTLSILGRLN
jgi:hypothetical protein